MVTSYTLDGRGQASALSSPDTGSSTASYDEAGNLTLKSDARSKTGTLTFDALNRPTSISYSGSSVTFGYDAGYGVGKLTSMTDSSGSTAWTYDKLGRITQKALTTGYTYLAGGRVATMTYPSGAVVGFTYDGANVASITVNGVTVVSGVTYFPFGGPKGWTMGSIGAYARQMDAHGRITSHTSEYGTRTLTWDASSRLTNIAETGQPARTYTYDNLNRLVTASEAASRGYAYDLTGNRTGETVNGTSYTYSVDSTSNRLSSSTNDVHSRTYAFDASGNTTGDGARTFTYDDVGQLASVTSSGGAAQYGYNGAGQRVSKTTSSGTKYYAYAEDGVSLTGEYGAAGAAAPVVETVYLNGLPVLVLKGGAVYYVLPDHLATPRAIKDSAGSVVWRWSADAFGNGAANESPMGGAQFVFNQRFPGQQFDAETGLYYNNARYYDPQVGRYITSDPVGLEGGLNTFAYVASSPLAKVDPSGLAEVNNFSIVTEFSKWSTANSLQMPGWFVYAGHGNEMGIRDDTYGGQFQDADAIAARIKGATDWRGRPTWSGQAVALISCMSGRGDGKFPSLAQKVANKLGVPVMGYEDYAWYTEYLIRAHKVVPYSQNAIPDGKLYRQIPGTRKPPTIFYPELK